MLKLITDRHEASQGLFATAELVVILSFCLVTLFASSWCSKSASAFESVQMLEVKSVSDRSGFELDLSCP